MHRRANKQGRRSIQGNRIVNIASIVSIREDTARSIEGFLRFIHVKQFLFNLIKLNFYQFICMLYIFIMHTLFITFYNYYNNKSIKNYFIRLNKV